MNSTLPERTFLDGQPSQEFVCCGGIGCHRVRFFSIKDNRLQFDPQHCYNSSVSEASSASSVFSVSVVSEVSTTRPGANSVALLGFSGASVASGTSGSVIMAPSYESFLPGLLPGVIIFDL